MIILDATTKTLEIDLAGAITTSQLPVVASYVDVTTTAYTPISTDTATNSTTAVTIVSAPAATTQRQVKFLNIHNADTVSATVTVQLNNNGTLRLLVVESLASGSTLTYTDGKGWQTITSAGAIVTSTLSPMTSAQLAAILSDETGSGAAVFATSPTLVTPVLGVASATSLAVPAITTAAGALTVTPAAGSGVNVVLSGAGDLAVNTDQLYVDTSTGFVGIGTTSPAYKSEIVAQGADATFSSKVFYDGAAVVAGYRAFTARGTVAAPTAVQSGDIMCFFGAHGYGATGFSAATKAAVLLYAAEAWTDSAQGAYIAFHTTATGGTTRTEKARINHDGNFGVGDNAPSGKLHVDQSSTTAAIPVLKLDQADISEGFIDYIGTSAASAAGPISSWTVATIAGYVRCEINGAAFWQPYYNAPTA